MKLTVITRRTAKSDLARITRGTNKIPASLLAFRAAVVDGPKWARIECYGSTRDAAARLAYDTLTGAHPGVSFEFTRRDIGVVPTL